MRKAIPLSVKNKVLKEKSSNPHLGVRGLAILLKEKHKINISKSAIHNILKAKGLKLRKGRKRSILLYKRKAIPECGLFLLRCIDQEIGLVEKIAEYLKAYFPRIKEDLLKRLILLMSFSSYLGGGIGKNIKKNGFLRIAGLTTLSHKKIDYFFERIGEYNPAISLKELKDNLKLATTIKLYFQNGDIGYCDGSLTTLWDSPCKIDDFFSFLPCAKTKVSQIAKDKIFMLCYTKSFGHISPTLLQFITGLGSGIKKVDFLGKRAEVLDSISYSNLKLSFFIGYYPRILDKGLDFLEKAKKFKEIDVLGDKVLHTAISTRFSQFKDNKGVILDNILIKRKERSLPSWGILTDKKENINSILKKYLILWPYMESAFLEEIKIIENFFLKSQKSKDLVAFLPKTLNLEKEADFAQIAQILGSIFKESIGELEFKQKSGEFIKGKDVFKVLIGSIPKKIKKKFNKSHFFLNDKRILLI